MSFRRNFGDRVRLSCDGTYDHILPCDFGDEFDNEDSGEPYISEAVLQSKLPDELDIYRAIKASGARRHIDIAREIAKLYKLEKS